MELLQLTPDTLKVLTKGSVWFASWRKDIPILITVEAAVSCQWYGRPHYRYIDKTTEYEMIGLNWDRGYYLIRASGIWELLYG